ncbi:hypothetical protein [Thaumasiovibrio sp. DFM-14]|uniref:hypothetical protein n=1 Tax=Thaumasiovibrio sp. DFM-14 TaxID=3384792 RepID=UPI0039A20BF6
MKITNTRIVSWIAAILALPSIACPFHGLEVDGLTAELSHTISYYIQHNRKTGLLTPSSNDAMVLFSFLQMVKNADNESVAFHLRQPIDGHLSSFDSTSTSINLSYKESGDLPVLITETDVLHGLVTRKLSWTFAKVEGLVTINGSAEQREQLDRIFQTIFGFAAPLTKD